MVLNKNALILMPQKTVCFNPFTSLCLVTYWCGLKLQVREGEFERHLALSSEQCSSTASCQLVVHCDFTKNHVVIRCERKTIKSTKWSGRPRNTRTGTKTQNSIDHMSCVHVTGSRGCRKNSNTVPCLILTSQTNDGQLERWELELKN